MFTFPTIMGFTSFFQINFFSKCVTRPSYKLFLTFIFAFQPYSYFFLNNFHVIKTCLELTWNLFMIKTNKLQFSINIQRERRKITMNTVMDNDYLTRLLVILLTNLLNNHCPWLYIIWLNSHIKLLKQGRFGKRFF